MDTNNNNQLLHTFEKGMDTDTSDAWLESGKYRSARNLRYLTDNGENTGELHSIEGWVDKHTRIGVIYPSDVIVMDYGTPVMHGEYCFLQDEIYLMEDNTGIREFDVQGRQFGHNLLCCHNGIVYKCILEEGEIASDQFTPSEWLGVSMDDLNDDGYVGDPINVLPSILAATTIRDLGILVVKDGFDCWYVFTTQDNFTDTNCVFGPCEETIGDGYKNKLSLVTRWEDDDNVKLYIADGEHELMVVNVCPTESTIPTTILEITNNLSVNLSSPQISLLTTGYLKPALVLYSYKLYNQYGAQSTISPLSQITSVGKILNDVIYGIPYGKVSSCGVRVSININTQQYKKIQLYRITYEMNGQNPTIDVIYDGDISDSVFVFDDCGNQVLQNITAAEYNSVAGINIIPKEIESKNDYLFAANIKYKQIEDFDDWDARSYNNGCYILGSNGQHINVTDYSDDYSQIPKNKTIYHENWNLREQYDEGIWRALPSSLEYNHIGGHGLNVDWEFVTEEVELDSSTQSVGIIKDEHSFTLKRTLRRGEMYRYGIVLYHKDGYKSEVKWIADIRIPDFNDTAMWVDPTEIDKVYNGYKLDIDNNVLLGYNVGIKFTISQFPNNCTGYEIVRCPKTIQDSSIVTQGAVSRLLRPQPDPEDGELYINIPSGFLTLDAMDYISSSQVTEVGRSDSKRHFTDVNVSNEKLLFFSPEISYQSDDVQSVLNSSNIYAKPLYYCFPFSGVFRNYDNDLYINPSVSFNRTSLYTTGGFFQYLDGTSGNYARYFCYAAPNAMKGTNNWGDGYGIYKSNGVSDSINANFLKTDKRAYNPLFYIKLYTKDGLGGISLGTVEQENVEITDTLMLDSKDYNSFASVDENINVLNDIVPIARENVHQWVTPYIYTQDHVTEAKSQLKNGSSDNPHCSSPIGSSGKSLLFVQEKDNNDICLLFFDTVTTTSNVRTSFASCICNITKDVNPYGGQEYITKTNNIYNSYGNFKPSSNNEINVFDGDCYLRCFECFTMHDWYHPTLKTHMNMSVVYSIPVETSIDIELDHGSRYSKLNGNNTTTINRNLNLLQYNAAAFANYYVQERPMYQYNTAYSTSPNVQQYTGVDEESKKNDTYDYRVHYSNLKTNNEQIDSWTQFKSANYLDVDTRYGEITDLRLFKDRLLFWQNEAVGLLSVNERTVLQDLNDYNIILGNGDVLQRYDYITTEYGMEPNQYADGQSNTCLYWWDGYKKEILAYAGEGVVPTGRTNSIHSYLSNIIESDPTLTYDDKYNEMLFSISADESVVFNEVIKAYTAVYDVAFLHKMNFVDQLLLCDNNNSIVKWNSHTENTRYLPAQLLYVANANPTYTKVYDDMLFECFPDNATMKFTFNTPLGQTGKITNTECSKRERDFRMRIPRAGSMNGQNWEEASFGDRLRGKTMDCTLDVNSGTVPFSIQYLITKFRISWS